MAKKGVAKIIGNQSPMVGEKQIYRIESWYPDTPLIERNPQNVTWELFKKRKNGIFTTTNIKKKGIGEFTFGEIAQKHTYLLEAYLYAPEGKGIIINPQPSKIPKINKVELFYLNGNKGQVFSFTEKFIAKAYCVNLEGKELKFTLWEDDEKGNGHSEKNLIVETKKAKVDSKGVAKVDFQLTKALIQKAQRGETDARELEFYVTVEYYAHKKHATENIHIKNPEVKKEAPKSPQNSKISKAPNSPASKKGESKKEEKGILDSVEESLRKIANLFDWGETRGKANKDKKSAENKPQSNKTVVVNVEEKKEEKKKEQEKKNITKEKGTVVIVSGTDTINQKDPAVANLKWVMYKTSVYRDMSLDTFKKLQKSNSLPKADYITYLSRDTHQVQSARLGVLKHSDKRYGKYNETPPGEYFLVPKVKGQTYEVYVVDQENKRADSDKGIEGPDGARGGVALHQYCPRFSVGCFTFNSGKNTKPVKDFIKEIPDLKLGDGRPVHFIVEPRKVIETTWDNPKHGTKKWIGI